MQLDSPKKISTNKKGKKVKECGNWGTISFDFVWDVFVGYFCSLLLGVFGCHKRIDFKVFNPLKEKEEKTMITNGLQGRRELVPVNNFSFFYGIGHFLRTYN